MERFSLLRLLAATGKEEADPPPAKDDENKERKADGREETISVFSSFLSAHERKKRDVLKKNR